MKPFPDNAKDLPHFEETCEAIEKFIKTRWNGIRNFKPKGWAKLAKDYTDFDGMQEYCDSGQAEKDADDFDGLNISSAGAFGFTSRVSLPHTMYDKFGQGRSPLAVFIGAVLGYGMRMGMLRGKEEATTAIVAKMSYSMIDKILDSDLDTATKVILTKMAREVAGENLK